MEYLEFKEIFKENCLKNDIKDIKNIEKFYKYMNLLLDWNQKINLTSIVEEKEFIVKHFVDSLIVTNFIKDYNRVIDVGTGAGFPGIPLKLFNEKTNITLIDSVNKKINVLNDIIIKLDLNNINALHIRAEELARHKEYRESYYISISRAVANMSTLVEYLMPFTKIEGKIICMKGPNYEDELENSKKAITILGGKIEDIKTYKVNNEFERNVIIINKIKSTPLKYPRGQGKPLKEPIKWFY